jgi:uncharacterized membrane protein YphA (DoxX/SURF4 family)
MSGTISNRTNLGLLLLRGAALLLALTFGRQKLGWYLTAWHSGESIRNTGLTPLIESLGFPAPFLLAVWETLNESLGAFLIGFGLLTRVTAASAALGMAGALYASLQLKEDWLRAALYLIVFSALALTGPGELSFDDLIKGRRKRTVQIGS